MSKAYEYDWLGRLTKTINGTTTAYVYDGIDLLYAKEGDTVTEKNIIEDDGSMILSCRGTVPYWYRQDIRGSVTNIIDGGGTVQKSYTYDAYGNTTASTETFENHHTYTGAYMDDETGLYYLSSRYYDPKTGSFTSADSYRGEGEQFWQLYAYCEGDPVNYSDLSGHKKKAVVIYRQNTFKLASRGEAHYLTKKKYSVTMKSVVSASDFVRTWNTLHRAGKIEYVSIIIHSGPHALDFENGSALATEQSLANTNYYHKKWKQKLYKAYNVTSSSALKRNRNIRNVRLLSCNGGHKYHMKDNLRKMFYEKIWSRGCVYSCNGSVSHFKFSFTEDFYNPHLSKDQNGYKKGYTDFGYRGKVPNATGFYC